MRPPPANPGRGCRKDPLGPATSGHATRTEDDLLVTTLLACANTDQGRSSAFRVNLRDGCMCLSTTWAVKAPVSRSPRWTVAGVPVHRVLAGVRIRRAAQVPVCAPPVHRQPVEAPPVPGPIGLGLEAGERAP